MPILEPQQHEVETAAYYCYERGGRRPGHALKDWIQGEQLVFIAKNYVVLGEYKLQNEHKIKLWNAQSQTCRYCGTVKPPKTAWKEAHALPESVGNTSIIAKDECSKCNDYFAHSIEDDFGKYLNLSKSATRIPGKKGIPSFKTSKGKSRIDWENGKFKVEQYYDDPFASIDVATKTVTMASESQPCTPLAIYKCFTKMAIAIMPPHFLHDYRQTIAWLMNGLHEEGAADVASMAKCLFQFQPGPQPNTGRCLLFKKRIPNTLIPDTIFVLTVGNQSFQIMIPCLPCDNALVGKSVPLPTYPAFYGMGYEFGEPHTKTWNLSSTQRQRIPISISLTAEQISSL
jgi:hypothetical protein